MNIKKTFNENKSTNPLITAQKFQKIKNIDDMKNIYRKHKDNNKKIFYANKAKIHEILHASQNFFYFDENQDLKNINQNLSLSESFYLSLLLLEYGEYDYICSFNYIELIYNYLKQNENKIKQYQKIIISKILDCLIENYKDIEEYEYECEFKYKEKIKEIEAFIQKNLKDYGKKKIDAIYLEIIISLIKNHKFSDYDYCYDIIKQIDLENIDITRTIFDGLCKTFNNKDINMEDYIINNNIDITDETKINFYYILIKFILKNNNINNIKFLKDNIENLRTIIEDYNFSNDQKFPKILENLSEILNIKKSFYSNEYSKNQSSNQNIFEDVNRERQIKNDGKDFTYDSSLNLNNTQKENNNVLEILMDPDKTQKILEKFHFKLYINAENDEKKIHYFEITYGKENQYMDGWDNLGKKMECKSKKDEIIFENYKKLLFFLEEGTGNR